MELGIGVTCFEDIIKLILTLQHLLQKLLILQGENGFFRIMCSNYIRKI